MIRKDSWITVGFVLAILAPLAAQAQASPNAAQTANLRIAAASCEAGDGASCEEAAGYHYNGQGTPINVQLANDFFLKACALGEGQSCRNVAMVFAQGALGPQDLVSATAYFVKACDAGDATGCDYAAGHYEDGVGAAQSDIQSLNYYEKACYLGMRSGCIAVVNRLDADPEKWAQRIPQDPKRALPAYAEMCTRHDMEIGCFQAAVVQTELGNPGLALPFYHEACRDGDADACFNASLIYSRDGMYAKKSGGLAAMVLTRACDLGDPRSCELMRDYLAKEDSRYLNGIDPLRPNSERYIIARNDLMDAAAQETDEQKFAYYSAWSTMAWLGEEGDINGIAFLGDAYMHGSSEYPQDHAVAKRLLEQAYSAGNMDAAWDLGYLYALDWERDKTDANRRRFMAPIKAAADAGHVEAKAYYEREMAAQLEYERALAEHRAESEAIAQYLAQQTAALNEMNRRNKNAMDRETVARAWGALAQSQDENEVCALILQGGRMTNECMSKERFQDKYTPWASN